MTDKLFNSTLPGANRKKQKFWLITHRPKRKKRFQELLDPLYWRRADTIVPFGKESSSPLIEQVQVDDQLAVHILDPKGSINMIVAMASVKVVLSQQRGSFQISWDSNFLLTRVNWPSGFQLPPDSHFIELTDPASIYNVFKKQTTKPDQYSETTFSEVYDITSIPDEPGFQYVIPPSEESKGGEEEISHAATYMRPAQAIQDDRLHRKIQSALTKILRNEHGFENVSSEHPAGYGAHAIDVVVRRSPTEFLYYEIKTYNSVMASIREALGQIIEYHMYPNKLNATELIILSHMNIETNTACKTYICHLRKQMGLPIYYQSFDLHTKQLSKKY